MLWITLLLCLCLGCAQPAFNPTSMHFTKPGASEADYKQDSYTCERECEGLRPHPNAYAYPGGLLGIQAMNEFQEKKKAMFTRCMEAKGWQLKP